jgi:3-dehydroquinate synthase
MDEPERGSTPAAGLASGAGVVSVEVRTGGGPGGETSSGYPVHVGIGALEGLAREAEARIPRVRLALISDDTVAALHADAVEAPLRAAGRDVHRFTFPAGEARKSRAQWAALTDGLLAAGFGRDSAIIALGGGVTGDLAGFVAATYMRGVPVVQIPTSLVAMIDSAVGGKTGVDVPAGKNLVGAFHPPAFVLVDPRFTTTLPRKERAEGLVEAIKHGLIADAAYLEALERDAPLLLDGDIVATFHAVLRSVEIKADVVSRDEREGGIRQILNFGHTLGHALEARSEYRLGHGAAVATGMVLEAWVGEVMGVTLPGTRDRVEAVLSRFEQGGHIPSAWPDAPDVASVLALTRSDKKARQGAVRYALLSHVGQADSAGGAWSHAIADDIVTRVLGAAFFSESDSG